MRVCFSTFFCYFLEERGYFLEEVGYFLLICMLIEPTSLMIFPEKASDINRLEKANFVLPSKDDYVLFCKKNVHSDFSIEPKTK